MATEVKRNQIENVVDTSWATLAAEEDLKRKRIETILVGVGAEGGSGRVEVLDSDKNENIGLPLVSQPDREDVSLQRTCRITRLAEG